MLNTNLDRLALKAQFAEDGRVRIENIFEANIAERIRECCLNKVPFEYTAFVDGANVTIPEDEMKKLDAQQLQDMQRQIMTAAADGIGFYYCSYMMAHAQEDTNDPELNFLHRVFDYLSSEEMLSFVSDVTGADDLKSADGQYTRYSPGQFLTRHQDDTKRQQRRLAYVMAFSKDWHPDWGGLLQFFERDGTPRDAWTPKFNSMSLFDVRHVHSVTYVTPFAKQPRLSLTGWFRAVA